MGTYVVKVPDIGEGIAQVELVEWHVQPGDIVVEEQSLADVMTDKATVEIPAPVGGKVLALAGKPGDTIAVGAELMRFEVKGPGNVAADAAAPHNLSQPAAQPETAPPQSGAQRSRLSEAAPARLRTECPPAALPRSPGERPIASPAVRRRAWDLGIELRFVHGSGPSGRIMNEDLDAYAAGKKDIDGAASATYLTERNDEVIVPVIGLRRKMAHNMQEAKRRIAHFTYVEEVDVSELQALRAQLNRQWQARRGRLTLLPFIVRAIVRAAPEFPDVNARFDDEGGAVTRYGAVHMGIATQTENGLMVPVVRHAEGRDLWACAAEIARLAGAARRGEIGREELSGSTVTITSLGPLGGIATTPIINHPEVAIVGVNRIMQRPMIRGSTIVPRLVMNLSCSFDHRVVDGTRGAQFVQALRSYLEAPATLFIA